MPQVKVWNDNVHEYKELFRGDLIKIPPKSFVLMDLEDAVMFRGSYAPIHRDADGQPLPTSYKMIRVDASPTKAEAKLADTWKCQACAYNATSKTDLDEHIDGNHLDKLLDQEVAEKRRRGRPAKESE